MNDGQDFNIRIGAGTIIKTILLIILVLVLYYIKDIVLVVLAAVVIASATEPATLWFAKYKIRRLPAVVIIYLGLGLILACFLIFFVPNLLNEAFSYLNNIPENITLNDIWNPLHETGIVDTLNPDPISEQSFSIKEILDASKDMVAGTGQGVFKIASLIFGGALSFILIIVLSFYLAVQEDGVGDFLRIITPRKYEKYIINLWKRSQKKIGYWMQGQLLLGLIVGVLVYLGLSVLGIKHALLLASVAALFELIPIFGPILAAVPAALIAVVDFGVTQMIVVIFLYLIIQQFENHLLYPLVVRKIVGISPIIVILALVIGAKLAGFLGALLAVPVASAFMEYISDVEKEKQQEMNLP